MSSSQPPSPPTAEEWEQMLTPKEFAKALRVSISFLAKARKRKGGPPFYQHGRLVRYFPLRRPK
jgi:hypothetical protein